MKIGTSVKLKSEAYKQFENLPDEDLEALRGELIISDINGDKFELSCIDKNNSNHWIYVVLDDIDGYGGMADTLA
jgi:hypothetical protein